jgi:hypothetical protein
MSLKHKQQVQQEASKSEKLARQQVQSEAYPGLLMNTLERVTKVGGSIDVVNGSFVVSHRVSLLDSLTRSAELTYKFCQESQEELDDFMRSLLFYEQDLAEECRKSEVRAAGLAKLTIEERKLLGL